MTIPGPARCAKRRIREVLKDARRRLPEIPTIRTGVFPSSCNHSKLNGTDQYRLVKLSTTPS